MDLRKVIFALLIVAISASNEAEDDSRTTVTRKERFLLATLKFRNRICDVGGLTGVCKSWKDCWLGRGTNMGPCTQSQGQGQSHSHGLGLGHGHGLGHGSSVCCRYEYTCGNMTSERVSYFVSPAVVPSTCTFRVNVYDRRVTQLRLDFEIFTLAQPEKRPEFSNNAYYCYNDTFTVISSAGLYSHLGFNNLCGENSGQHIYVPVNATLGPASVDLIFNTLNRQNNSYLVSPRWKIKITQIDCCAPDTRYLCAPDGCLQYYPAPSGSFESFNFNGGRGHYQGLLNYAICFKRYNNICSIQYSASTFSLPANNFDTPYGNDGCNLPTINPNDPFSRDYLFIPAARWGNNADASLFCGQSLQTSSATTNAPGPMFVFFRTDDVANIGNGDDIGFHINYQEMSSGCYGVQGFFG